MEELFNWLPTIIGVLAMAGAAWGTYEFVVHFYQLATKERAFVRTGLFGEKVVMSGGAFVLPRLQAKIDVNMTTLRLEVSREKKDALITRDRMRVDVIAEFYVRVKNDEESVATAARTLGKKTLNLIVQSENTNHENPEEPIRNKSKGELADLIEGKFVDALRAVAAEMTMKELHEKRSDFIEKVQLSVTEDLTKNGLELETVSLTGLDQTERIYFNEDNAFDAEGLVRLAEITEARRKERNDIERDNDIAMQTKNLQAEREKLKLAREEEYARSEQEREVAIRKVEQEALIEAYRIEKRKELELKKLEADRDVLNEGIRTEQAIKLTEQERTIAIAEKSRLESAAKAEADKARAMAVLQEETVEKVRETERAERLKAVQIIAAQEEAQKAAISVKVSAAAEKQAALDKAESIKILADAQEKQYVVDAEGREKLNKAANVLSPEQVEMQIRLKTIEQLPDIIRESAKPMENIDEIKILQVNGGGLMGGGGVSGSLNHQGEVGLADQVVNSALRYRSQAPLVDGLLREIGLQGGDINGLTQTLQRHDDVIDPTPDDIVQPKNDNSHTGNETNQEKNS
ncbi:flotillin family protein [Alysiella crassa]|uniref:Inner membrane protein yqiK n=1 Tax=Alysiella crassa TaxID=153491 RepID=A0A376BK54_9NEIS|nr:Inner membrane protein yqiK [Alysiella crassa]